MKNILQYFEETCEQFPDYIAVANESSSVTFNDLKTRSQQAGTMIASELKQDSLPVAIYIDKSLALVEAMLSVLYSGNFYVVLDTQMPVERVRRIFETFSRQRFSQINLILIKLNLLIILKMIMR